LRESVESAASSLWSSKAAFEPVAEVEEGTELLSECSAAPERMRPCVFRGPHLSGWVIVMNRDDFEAEID